MKIFMCILSIFLMAITISTPVYSMDLTAGGPISTKGPKCTEGEAWEFIINNAYREADTYATSNNPNSVFATVKKSYSFVKQFGGKHKGKYLLMITNKHAGHTSFIVLLPLFNVNKASNDLNDEKTLWKVVNAKFDGIPY